MKLDAGQVIMPVPWPIHRTPMASAIRPSTSSKLRMGFLGSDSDVFLCPVVFKDGRQLRHKRLWREETKKPRTMPGLFKFRSKSDQRKSQYLATIGPPQLKR